MTKQAHARVIKDKVDIDKFYGANLLVGKEYSTKRAEYLEQRKLEKSRENSPKTKKRNRKIGDATPTETPRTEEVTDAL